MTVKKLTRILFAAALLMSVFASGVFAAQAKPSDTDTATEGADKSLCLNFVNSETKWEGLIQFYVYHAGSGDAQIPWGSKKLNGTDNGDGTWSFDPAEHGMRLYDYEQYCVIFVDGATGAQTYDLVFDHTCLGDTATTTDCRIEAPTDSFIGAVEAVWKSGKFGAAKKITSIGNVVGSYCPGNNSMYNMFVGFLKNYLKTAQEYAQKDDQTMIDDVAAACGLDQDEAEKAIAEAGVSVAWSKKDQPPSPKTGRAAELYWIIFLMAAAAVCAGVSVRLIANQRG